MNICIKPYSDDYMVFDETTGHYVLTEKAIVERCGIDLRARLSQDATLIPEVIIKKLCRTVSDMIYTFIHDCGAYNHRQDCLIATRKELRDVVQRAMEYQMEFVLANGDLYMTVDNSEIGKEIHRMAQSELINSGLCYGGV